MSIAVEGLEIEIKQKAVGATKAINNLTMSMRHLNDSVRQSFSSITAFNYALQNTKEFAGALAKNLGAVNSKAGKTASSIKKAVEETKKEMDVSGKGTGSVQKMGAFKSALTSIKKSLGDVKDKFKELNPHVKKLFKSIGRIALYRALRSIIKSITDAVKYGVENAYKFSQTMGGEFAQTMDKLHSVASQMKNQFGSAFSELIIMAQPILERLMSMITSFANKISQVFAMLNGDNQYKKANPLSLAWKEATSSAKKYKDMVLGIDELNIINDDSGNGGSSASTDYESMFTYEDVELSERLTNVLGFLKDNIESVKEVVLDVGAGFLAWKISKGILEFFGESGKYGVTIGGIATSFLLVKDALEDIKEAGSFTTDAFWKLEGAIGAIGIAFAVAIGPIALIPALIAGALVAIVKFKDEIGEALGNAWDYVKRHFEKFINDLKKGFSNLGDFFKRIGGGIAETAQGLWDGIKSGFNSVKEFFANVGKGIVNGFKSAVNGVISFIESGINLAIGGFNKILDPIRKAGNFALSLFGVDALPQFSLVSIPRLADGGIVPSNGQLFMANEAGSPEMIGAWGSQTAVANTDQIVQGIQQGVASALSGVLAPYLAQIANNTRETANKDVSIRIGDREIAQASRRGQRLLGASLIN